MRIYQDMNNLIKCDVFDGKVGEGTREGLLCLENDFLERGNRSSKRNLEKRERERESLKRFNDFSRLTRLRMDGVYRRGLGRALAASG